MTKKKLAKFEKILKEEREKVLLKLNYDKNEYGDLSKTEVGDIVDQAYNMYEKDRTIQISETEKKALHDIDMALQRIKLSTYGKCKCGAEIEENRLEAIPWTTTCTKCVQEKNGRKIG